MVGLRWSPRAAQDFEDICDYIARDSEHYARVFAERIMSIVESIPSNPQLGAMVPEYQREDLRERLFHNYRVVYRVHRTAVEIVTVVHGAGLLPPNLVD